MKIRTFIAGNPFYKKGLSQKLTSEIKISETPTLKKIGVFPRHRKSKIFWASKSKNFLMKVKSKSKRNKSRIFIALDLPREVINEIKRVQEIINKKKLFDGKLVEPENLHLTLKFLGEINEDKIEEVKKRLRKIRFEGFESNLGEGGVFSSKYKSYARVIWIKLEGKCVWELQKKIDEALDSLFEKEHRFMGHITLARIKRVYDRKGFLDYVCGVKVKKIKFKVDKFFLKKSERFPEGPVYEDLEEYKLSGAT